MFVEFSGLEWAALFVIGLMILGPLEAGAVHASQQGWEPAKTSAMPARP
jgi:hypothetical protein